MTTIVYRVQAADGRGPWRPGWSHTWMDPLRTGWPPSWIEEFGLELRHLCPPAMHMACGTRTVTGLREWFMPSELARLRTYGYQIVLLEADAIIAESRHQVVFARQLPLNIGSIPLVDGRPVPAVSEEPR